MGHAGLGVGALVLSGKLIEIFSIFSREAMLRVQIPHLKDETKWEVERIPKPPIETETVEVLPIYEIFIEPVDEIIGHCSSRDFL